MNILAKSLVTAGLFFAFTTCASAKVTWTLSDVTFDNGNVATGNFTTNAKITGFDSSSIISGPDTAADFTVDLSVASAHLDHRVNRIDRILLIRHYALY
jgi:hypothetical protein